MLNSLIQDDDNVSQFFNTNLSSKYADVVSFKTSFHKSDSPLILSVSIQSLNSKFTDLKNLVTDLQMRKFQLISLFSRKLGTFNILNFLKFLAFNLLYFKTGQI